MAAAPDPARFTRALVVYFGDDSSPGYDPTATLEGTARIRAEFPEDADRLIAQLDRMFEAALGLPGLDPLALAEAAETIRVFVAAEYRFLPPLLQAKVANCCTYRLWK